MRRDGQAPIVRCERSQSAEPPPERLVDLGEQGFGIAPGDLGENIPSHGIDVFRLPRGSRLHIGPDVVLKVTGLRNLCWQLDNFQEGLMPACLPNGADGKVELRAGIMTIVVSGGEISVSDLIWVSFPELPYEQLRRV